MLLSGRGVSKDLANTEEEAGHVPHNFVAHTKVLAMVHANLPPKLGKIDAALVIRKLSIDLGIQRLVGALLQHRVEPVECVHEVLRALENFRNSTCRRLTHRR